MKRQLKRRRTIIKPDPTYKQFFTDDAQPTYKKWEVLSHFISDRGKILPRTRTAISATTQRRLSREIKRARHLALIPFVVRPV